MMLHPARYATFLMINMCLFDYFMINGYNVLCKKYNSLFNTVAVIGMYNRYINGRLVFSISQNLIS